MANGVVKAYMTGYGIQRRVTEDSWESVGGYVEQSERACRRRQDVLTAYSGDKYHAIK